LGEGALFQVARTAAEDYLAEVEAAAIEGVADRAPAAAPGDPAPTRAGNAPVER
jgi:hypothetical protein